MDNFRNVEKINFFCQKFLDFFKAFFLCFISCMLSYISPLANNSVAIHHALVILSLSYLKIKLKQEGKNDKNDEKKIIQVTLPYLKHIGDKMQKRCFKKSPKRLIEKVYFFTSYETKKKIFMFCSTKDITPTIPKLNVIYCLKYPCSNENYIGKTDRNLVTGLH